MSTDTRQLNLTDLPSPPPGLTVSERKVWVACELHGLRPVDVAREHPRWTASTVRSFLRRARIKEENR